MSSNCNQVRSAFESGDELCGAMKIKHAIETAQHISVIKMASEKIEKQEALLYRTLKMFDGALSGDLGDLLNDIRGAIGDQMK